MIKKKNNLLFSASKATRAWRSFSTFKARVILRFSAGVSAGWVDIVEMCGVKEWNDRRIDWKEGEMWTRRCRGRRKKSEYRVCFCISDFVPELMQFHVFG
jgi:hypothetical protein